MNIINVYIFSIYFDYLRTTPGQTLCGWFYFITIKYSKIKPAKNVENFSLQYIDGLLHANF